MAKWAIGTGDATFRSKAVLPHGELAGAEGLDIGPWSHVLLQGTQVCAAGSGLNSASLYQRREQEQL